MQEFSEKRLNDKLKILLSNERYVHSLGVMQTASNLALKYSLDAQKVRIAALLHDCAKELTFDEMISKITEFKMNLDSVSLRETVLLHGPLGAKIAEYEYGVTDKEILSSIDCHTTGKLNMTLFDKIIYISDFIEPNRDFDGVKQLRNIACKNLDFAVKVALDYTIFDLLNAGKLIHPRTLEARNQLLLESKFFLKPNVSGNFSTIVDKTSSIDIIGK